jgi:fructose-bisphosphate aldolase, class I
MSARLRLGQCGLSAGKKARLHRILYKHGLGNGTALFLPYDQGLEHGPRDFFADPIASDPKYIVRLALEGGFNGIAIQVGLAEKFYWDYAGEVPLILKLNGKTDIPSDASALSPLHASVEDAVRLGPMLSDTRCMSARPLRTPTSRSTGSSARTPSASACR